jgi:hypothetical protein
MTAQKAVHISQSRVRRSAKFLKHLVFSSLMRLHGHQRPGFCEVSCDWTVADGGMAVIRSLTRFRLSVLLLSLSLALSQFLT